MDIKTVSNALDNMLWVEQLIQDMVKNGSAVPLIDLLKTVQQVHPESYNEITAKLERTLSKELDTWTDTKREEFKNAVEKIVVPIKHKYQIIEKDGKSIKNISWMGNMTFGCSYGNFILVISRYEFLSREGFEQIFVNSLEELNNVSCGIDGYAFTIYNGCTAVRTDSKELEQVKIIMIQNKCTCVTRHPDVEGDIVDEDCVWAEVVSIVNGDVKGDNDTNSEQSEFEPDLS